MGRPMALNLIAAGHALVVHNRTPENATPVIEAGASFAKTPGEVAERCQTVITMLPDSPDVEQVYIGEHGVLSSARDGRLLIDMSSIAPETARTVFAAAQRLGAQALDAPVSGGDVGAREGTLSIMVGGEEAAFQRALPILQTLGRTIVHVGGPGAGQTAKACNQLLVATTIEAVSEALVLASKAGVDPERLIEVLSGGLAGNRVLEVRRRNFLEHDFTPGFRVRLHLKDLGIALQTARELGVELPTTSAVEPLLRELVQSGDGDCDHSALLSVIERRAGHRIGPAKS